MEKKQFARLPKFAQSEINVLRNNLQYCEKQLNEMFGDLPTNMEYTYSMENKHLPNGCTVKFILDKHNYIEANIVDNQIRIYGSRGIKVIPRANNSIYLEGEGQ